MRAEPRVARKLWFGPRRDGFGWGWTPVSWEGWLVLAGWLLVVLGPAAVGRTDGAAYPIWTIVATAAVLGLSYLKDSTPGCRRQARELDAQHGRDVR